MERSRTSVLSMLIILLALMYAESFAAGSIYTCWGGCFNECFLETGKTTSERYPCYMKCLSSCVPRYPADYRYYCHIGCSAELCIPLSYDGKKMENCFGKCTDLCNRM